MNEKRASFAYNFLFDRNFKLFSLLYIRFYFLCNWDLFDLFKQLLFSD